MNYQLIISMITQALRALAGVVDVANEHGAHRDPAGNIWTHLHNTGRILRSAMAEASGYRKPREDVREFVSELVEQDQNRQQIIQAAAEDMIPSECAMDWLRWAAETHEDRLDTAWSRVQEKALDTIHIDDLASSIAYEFYAELAMEVYDQEFAPDTD